MARFFFSLALLLIFSSLLAAQKNSNRVPDADSPGDVKPGKTALLESTGKYPTKYFLRVPKSYDKEKGARVIVFMHGSKQKTGTSIHA